MTKTYSSEMYSGSFILDKTADLVAKMLQVDDFLKLCGKIYTTISNRSKNFESGLKNKKPIYIIIDDYIALNEFLGDIGGKDLFDELLVLITNVFGRTTNMSVILSTNGISDLPLRLRGVWQTYNV